MRSFKIQNKPDINKESIVNLDMLANIKDQQSSGYTTFINLYIQYNEEINQYYKLTYDEWDKLKYSEKEYYCKMERDLIEYLKRKKKVRKNYKLEDQVKSLEVIVKNTLQINQEKEYNENIQENVFLQYALKDCAFRK